VLTPLRATAQIAGSCLDVLVVTLVKIGDLDDDCAYFDAADKWWNVDAAEKALCGHSYSLR
jgi:hypothetical protein